MPDFKSELNKVLDEWSKPESTTMTKNATNSVTRATFNKVAANPGHTRSEIVAMLSTEGYKESSTTSLLTQMLAKGNLRLIGGRLFTNQNEYKPMVRTAPPKRRVKKGEPTVVVSAPETESGSPAQPQINSTWDVTDQLNSMSIVQARLMYDALRKIFGG